MTSHIPEELSTRIDWTPFAIMGNTMPPRDPDEDEEDGTKRKRTAPTNRRSCASRTRRMSAPGKLVRFNRWKTGPSRG